MARIGRVWRHAPHMRNMAQHSATGRNRAQSAVSGEIHHNEARHGAAGCGMAPLQPAPHPGTFVRNKAQQDATWLPGSPLYNWHSILRTGLKNMSNTEHMSSGAGALLVAPCCALLRPVAP
jgi:hypothetical protein